MIKYLVVSQVKWTIQYSLVMFFALHILMFLFIYPTNQNSLSINKKYINQDAVDEKKNTLQIGDHIPINTTNFITNKLMFKIIKNLTSTKAVNLKSNVFDKMLSDEILSIKKHFYKKDNTRTTIPVMISILTNAPALTLEIKPKWSMFGPSDKPVNEIRDENSLKNNNKIGKLLPEFKTDSKSVNIEEKLHNVNEKVLELRSLPEATPIPYHIPYQHHGYKVCTCMNTNPSTICSHRCTGAGSTAPCSYTSICVYCTRSTQQYSISHIYYQPYFVGVTTQLPYVNTYYHPDVINELKIPRKPKHRKTKPYVDKELYYDAYDKYYDDYLYNYETTRKPDDKDETDDTIKINMIEYREKQKMKQKPTKPKINHHVMKNNRDKLVEDIFDDLQTYYSDSVIKDCYCRSASSSLLENYISIIVVYALCFVY